MNMGTHHFLMKHGFYYMGDDKYTIKVPSIQLSFPIGDDGDMFNLTWDGHHRVTIRADDAGKTYLVSVTEGKFMASFQSKDPSEN